MEECYIIRFKHYSSLDIVLSREKHSDLTYFFCQLGRLLAHLDDGCSDGGSAQHLRRSGSTRAFVRGRGSRRGRLPTLRGVLRPRYEPLVKLRTDDATPLRPQRE